MKHTFIIMMLALVALSSCVKDKLKDYHEVTYQIRPADPNSDWFLVTGHCTLPDSVVQIKAKDAKFDLDRLWSVEADAAEMIIHAEGPVNAFICVDGVYDSVMNRAGDIHLAYKK